MSCNYPHQISVWRKISTNVAGAIERSWTPLTGDFAAFVTPASAHTQMIFEQRNLTVSHIIYTPFNVSSIKTGDIVKFGSVRQFSIKGVVNEGELNQLWKIMAFEVSDTEQIVEIPMIGNL